MESYVERPPLPGLAGVVRTVWIQRTGEAAYVQRHLPTGGVEIHFPIGGHPQLIGPLTGPEIEVIPAHTTIVGVRFQPGTAPPLPTVLDDLVRPAPGPGGRAGRRAGSVLSTQVRAPPVLASLGARSCFFHGSAVDCDHDRAPDLFWGLRGARPVRCGPPPLRFVTVPEPVTTRIEAHWPDIAPEERARPGKPGPRTPRTNSPSTSPWYLSPARLSRPLSSAPLPSRRNRPGSCCGSSPTGPGDTGRRSTPMLDPDVRRVLDGTSIAHLATVLPEWLDRCGVGDHRPAVHEVHRRALPPRARARRGCDRARATDRRCRLSRNTGAAVPAGTPPGTAFCAVRAVIQHNAGIGSSDRSRYRRPPVLGGGRLVTCCLPRPGAR